MNKKRVPFVLATNKGKTLTPGDTYYYRRYFTLWGKKVDPCSVKGKKKTARAAAKQPSSADAQTYLKAGIGYRDAKDYQNAIQYISHALTLDPHLDGGWAQLGYCYEQVGQVAQAREAYKSALEINPADSYASQRLSVLK